MIFRQNLVTTCGKRRLPVTTPLLPCPSHCRSGRLLLPFTNGKLILPAQDTAHKWHWILAPHRFHLRVPGSDSLGKAGGFFLISQAPSWFQPVLSSSWPVPSLSLLMAYTTCPHLQVCRSMSLCPPFPFYPTYFGIRRANALFTGMLKKFNMTRIGVTISSSMNISMGTMGAGIGASHHKTG